VAQVSDAAKVKGLEDKFTKQTQDFADYRAEAVKQRLEDKRERDELYKSMKQLQICQQQQQQQQHHHQQVLPATSGIIPSMMIPSAAASNNAAGGLIPSQPLSAVLSNAAAAAPPPSSNYNGIYS